MFQVLLSRTDRGHQRQSHFMWRVLFESQAVLAFFRIAESSLMQIDPTRLQKIKIYESSGKAYTIAVVVVVVVVVGRDKNSSPT